MVTPLGCYGQDIRFRFEGNLNWILWYDLGLVCCCQDRLVLLGLHWSYKVSINGLPTGWIYTAEHKIRNSKLFSKDFFCCMLIYRRMAWNYLMKLFEFHQDNSVWLNKKFSWNLLRNIEMNNYILATIFFYSYNKFI